MGPSKCWNVGTRRQSKSKNRLATWKARANMVKVWKLTSLWLWFMREVSRQVLYGMLECVPYR